MTTIQALRKAKARVAKGWSHGAPSRLVGKKIHVCAVIALEDSDPAYDQFVIANGLRSGCVSVWNDDPKRTKRQVLAAFDKAIKAAKATR